MENAGRLHAIGCERCGLKMACSCFFDENRHVQHGAHPLVMCPRCQATDFLKLLFGRDTNEQGQCSQ